VTNAVDRGSQVPISMARAVVDGGSRAYILGALVDERPGYFSVFSRSRTIRRSRGPPI
jgi:hypothetical protein